MSEEKKGSFIALGSMLLIGGIAAFGAEIVERKERNEERLRRAEDEQRQRREREQAEFIERSKRDTEALIASLRGRAEAVDLAEITKDAERIALIRGRAEPVDVDAILKAVERLEQKQLESAQRIMADVGELIGGVTEKVAERLEEIDRKVALAQHNVPYPFSKKEEPGN